jgi:hypothetical protein
MVRHEGCLSRFHNYRLRDVRISILVGSFHKILSSGQASIAFRRPLKKALFGGQSYVTFHTQHNLGFVH